MARNSIEQERATLPGSENVQLAGEIRHMQRLAAAHEARMMKVGALLLFSTEGGDAWLLHPQARLASRLSSAGEPEWVYFEESARRCVIPWQGRYRVEGETFVYVDDDSGREATLPGYPAARIAALG